jgi:hypothetical protein
MVMMGMMVLLKLFKRFFWRYPTAWYGYFS